VARIANGAEARAYLSGRVVTAALAVVGLACTPAAPPQFPAKPPDCALEMIYTLPQRPYVELETFALPSPESIHDVRRIVQERACRDGADAIYAPKGGRGYSYAIALKWNVAPPPAAPTPAP
jgi:hypothetical protein